MSRPSCRILSHRSSAVRQNKRPGRVRVMAATLIGLALAGCAGRASTPPPEPPSGPVTGPAVETMATGARLVEDYPVFEPVQPPRGYLRALHYGTRSRTGEPGPGYWQQWVHYRISASLDPKAGRVTGDERIVYVNNSPDTLLGVVVHLYQNIFAPGVERNRTVHLTGGIQLTRIESAGVRLDSLSQSAAMAHQGRPVGYVINGTIAHVFTPQPIAPGDTAHFRFGWSFIVPDSTSFRTGNIAHQIFNVAQWYPQIATFDDVSGWDDHPYLGNGEFYLEYGTFDIDLTVPRGWLVTATGALQNAEAVLDPETLSRYRSAPASDTVIHVVTADQVAAGRATATGSDGRITWRFHADSVRDFAFATSDRYVWDAVGARVEDRRVRIDALYDPSLEHWKKAASYSKHAIEFYSDYIFPYPYSHASAAYGPIGGMEYPMLVFIGRSSPGEPLYSVLSHEFSHEWFPMVVGSKEHAYTWMDEGLTTFDESLARADYFGHTDARIEDLRRYLQAAFLQIEAPLMEHTDYVENGYGRVIAAYQKPAVVLYALRQVLGDDTFHRAYRRYARAWRFKHPMPWDFFAVFEDEAGRDLDWFWQEWFYDRVLLDQAIQRVRQVGDSVQITVANNRWAVMPVDLRIDLQDGTSQSVRWPVDVWAGTREVTRSVAVSGTVVAVQIDPDGWYPDVDRRNNRWAALTGAGDGRGTNDRH